MSLSTCLIFTTSAASTALLAPFIARMGSRLGMVDHPGARRVHESVVPRTGGVAVAGGMVAALAVALALNINLIRGGWWKAAGIGCTILGVFLMGLWDDARPIRSQVKLAILITAGGAVYALGVRVEQAPLWNGTWMQFPGLAPLVTVGWIVAVTVGINFIDGLDGLAAGIGAMACLVIGWSCHVGGAAWASMLALTLCGSLLGFLVFNTNPAKVFLGDGGSMLTGFSLAVASAAGIGSATTVPGFALPVVALAIPVLDTGLTVIRRAVLERRSTFSAELGHIHHRLLRLGFSHHRAVWALYATNSCMLCVACAMNWTRGIQSLVVLACALAIPLMLFLMADALQIRNTARACALAIGRWRERRAAKGELDRARLGVEAAKDEAAWWREVMTAADRFGLTRVLLEGISLAPAREWRSQTNHGERRVRLTVDGRFGCLGRGVAELEAPVNGSTEATCLKLSMFARVLEFEPARMAPAPARQTRMRAGVRVALPMMPRAICEEELASAVDGAE